MYRFEAQYSWSTFIQYSKSCYCSPFCWHLNTRCIDYCSRSWVTEFRLWLNYYDFYHFFFQLNLSENYSSHFVNRHTDMFMPNGRGRHYNVHEEHWVSDRIHVVTDFELNWNYSGPITTNDVSLAPIMAVQSIYLTVTLQNRHWWPFSVMTFSGRHRNQWRSIGLRNTNCSAQNRRSQYSCHHHLQHYRYRIRKAISVLSIWPFHRIHHDHWSNLHRNINEMTHMLKITAINVCNSLRLPI